MSDPDGNDGREPDRADRGVQAAKRSWADPVSATGNAADGPNRGSGKRRRRRRRNKKNRSVPAPNIQPAETLERSANNGASAQAANAPAGPDVPASTPANRSKRQRHRRNGGPAPRARDADASVASRPEARHADREAGSKANTDAVSNGNGRANGRDRTNGKDRPKPYNSGNGKHRPWHRRHPRRSSKDLYAALDLGTNNCRLLIAEPRKHGFKVVDAFSRIVRLGEGVSTNGALRADAMDRALEALRICRRKLDNRGVKKVRMVATEACRSAENGQQFIDRVEEEANLKLEVLSRGGEAKLAVMGCAPLIDDRDDGALLFDIGGGSSEIAWIDLKKRHKDQSRCVTECIVNWASLPVGVVTLSERFGGVDVTPDVFERMVRCVDDMLVEAGKWDVLDKAISSGRAHFIGTSGTVTTIAGIHLDLVRYDRRLVDGIWLHKGRIDEVMQTMLAMSYPERVDNGCIGQDRADLVLGGCAILEAIRRRWPCRRLRVADRGLREGILMEMMTADGVWNRRPG